MGARQGSLPYVFVTSVIAIGLGGMLWGILEVGVVREVVGQNLWGKGSTQATQTRDWIHTLWDWVLFVILFRAGMQAIIASRLPGRPSSSMIRPTATLVIFHCVMVIWAFGFPYLFDQIIDLTTQAPFDSALSGAGLDTAMKIAIDLAFGYGPAVLVVLADILYLWAPIQSDAFGSRPQVA